MPPKSWAVTGRKGPGPRIDADDQLVAAAIGPVAEEGFLVVDPQRTADLGEAGGC